MGAGVLCSPCAVQLSRGEGQKEWGAYHLCSALHFLSAQRWVGTNPHTKEGETLTPAQHMVNEDAKLGAMK
jgi:hypothetical protein